MRRAAPFLFAATILAAGTAAWFVQRGGWPPLGRLPVGQLPADAPILYALTPGGTAGEVAPTQAAWRRLANAHGVRVIVPASWDDAALPDEIRRLRGQYPGANIFITGFSNGGYNACELGLAQPNLVAGVIALGASCDPLGVLDDQPRPIRLPVLVVAGEQDSWARGDDGKQIERANARLAAYGIQPEVIILPGLGHQFPTAALDDIGRWIEQHQTSQP